MKSANVDSFYSEISSSDSSARSSATQDGSDDSDYGEGASATKRVKKRNFQRKINRGEEMIVAQNNQSSQQASPATTIRNWNKNTNKKANQ